MVTRQVVEQQLKAIGVKIHFWNRPEVEELQQILIPGEVIHGSTSGYYEGGFAMLCATDQRLLLVDKKLFHLMVEDLRYDMIAEVDYSAQLLTGNIQVRTPTKTLRFTAFKPRSLRSLTTFIQQRVIEIRQEFSGKAPGQPTYSAPIQQFSAVEAPFIEPVTTEPGPAEAIQPPQAVTPPLPARALPTPQLGRNPYASTPLMIRRRIGRFGTIASSQPSS